MLWWWLGAALAGYGDARDGVPTPAERELHLWTNAARAVPDAFRGDYQRGGCSFDTFRQHEKQSQALLAWHPDLARVARDHSLDMAAHHSLSHDSSDGTSFGARVGRVYRGVVTGENVAFVSPSPYVTVMEGWMCSSGHRSNIMEPAFEELGTGVVGAWMTQDFGAPVKRKPALHMGVHTPWEPSGRVSLMVDYDGSDVDEVWAVVNGERLALDLTWGDNRRGVWRTSVTVGEGCQAYWFEEDLGGTRFPEEGAYSYGVCADADKDTGWLGPEYVAAMRASGDVDEGGGRGCSTVAPRGSAGLGQSLAAAGGVLLLALRRRRS